MAPEMIAGLMMGGLLLLLAAGLEIGIAMTRACGSPAPNTVCVAFAQSGQSWQARASSRSCLMLLAIDH